LSDQRFDRGFEPTTQGFSKLRIANCLLGALFLLGAVVQYNDPDPIRWAAIYLAAAMACVLAAIGRRHWALPAAVGVVAAAWAATLAPSVVGNVVPGELVGAWEMKDARVEVGREMYGLLIIAAWMAVLAITDLRRRTRRSTGSDSRPA
jgi:hypothetical protein